MSSEAKVTKMTPSMIWAAPLLALALAGPAAGAEKTIARAHPTAKANATGLELRHDAPATLKAGQRVVVRLQVRGARAADASVEVQAASPALRLLAVDGRAPGGTITLAPGATRRIEIELSAAADGPALVNVVMRQHGRVSISVIALAVGDTSAAPMKSEGALRTTPQGERIVVMPSSR